MDGQHLDRIARSLASGMSRRGTMKAVAAALGVAATRPLHSANAASNWCRGLYGCEGITHLTPICTAQDHRDVVRDRGTVCLLEQEAACGFASRESCESGG